MLPFGKQKVILNFLSTANPEELSGNRICSIVYTDAFELGRAEEQQQPAKAWHQFRYGLAGFSRSLAPYPSGSDC